MRSFGDSIFIYMIPVEIILALVFLLTVNELGISSPFVLGFGIFVIIFFGFVSFGLANKVYNDALKIGISEFKWSMVAGLVPVVGILAYMWVRSERLEEKEAEDEDNRIDLNQFRDKIVTAELAEGETLSKRKVVKRPSVNIDEHGQIKE